MTGYKDTQTGDMLMYSGNVESGSRLFSWFNFNPNIDQ